MPTSIVPPADISTFICKKEYNSATVTNGGKLMCNTGYNSVKNLIQYPRIFLSKTAAHSLRTENRFCKMTIRSVKTSLFEKRQLFHKLENEKLSYSTCNKNAQEGHNLRDVTLDAMTS